ncbi:MAG: ABC transporter ATP-binding protein [Candidatus Dormibacteria bacterium]
MTGDAPQAVIETAGLTKRFGPGVLAVDRLDLRVEPGQVYGFLGPNGAGKTTTLRMLVGLLRPTAGSAMVAGHTPGAPAGLAQIGVMVEEAVFYPYLSGRDNLLVVARYCRLKPSAVEPALSWVGLQPAAKFKFKTYSTGMKQRLGLAAALMKDPKVLLLDEPSNGLDPEGIVWLRQLLRGFAAKGGTALVSSHLLGEIEQMCDRVAIVQSGRLLREGPVASLRAAAQLEITAAPLDAAARLVEGLLGAAAVRVADGRLIVTSGTDRAAEINRALVGAGIEVSELYRRQASLEESFLRLTAEEGGPG